MGKLILLSGILVSIISCVSQPGKNVTLNIFNYSSYPIDSIIFVNDCILRTPIMPKDSIKKTVFIEGTQNESIKYLKVYTNNKVFLGSYGFSDMGYVYDEIDNFYVFNTGINKVNKPLSQPKEFSIFLFNDSGFEIESITFQEIQHCS